MNLFHTFAAHCTILSGVEVLQVLGVEMSRGGSTESNVRSCELFVTIYLSIKYNRQLYEIFNN
jgi:hypothetical protein